MGTEQVHFEALYSTLLRCKHTITEGMEDVKKGLISFSAAAFLHILLSIPDYNYTELTLEESRSVLG